MRINSFDYFRGIAIVLIVAGHSIPNSAWIPGSFIENLFAWLLRDNSSLFVFISGFFFHHIYHGKMSYFEFLKKKSVNILIPYAVLSFAYIFYTLLAENRLPNNDIIPDTAGKWIYLLFHYLINGKAFIPYWYIPFIYSIFILSFAFNIFIKIDKSARVFFLIVFFILSLLTGRPENFSVLGSVIYFLPFYLLGIIFSQYRETFLLFLSKHIVKITLGLSIVLIFQTYLISQNMQIIDLRVIQKILLIFTFLVLLDKFEKKQISYLRYAAATSFAIYFIHPWIFVLIDYLNIIDNITDYGFLSFLIVFVISLTASVLVAKSIKFLIKNKSKYLIGW